MTSKYLIALAGSTGAGVAGLVGYGLHNDWFSSTEKSSFKSRINKGERVILNDTHSNVWEQILAEYKDKSKAINLIKGIGQDNTTIESLKEWCSKMHDSTDKSEFNSYVSWCTRKNLITQLKEESKSWNNSLDDSGWTKVKTDYGKNDQTDVQIPDVSENQKIAKEKITESQIKNYCNTISSMPFIKTEDLDYKRANKWCINS
ncbi:hypothetical protein MHC_03155 [Mycoplasma haemocanis str. Illinois]|uniref:Uncharacterized protein n=1 Tax=Mycoplasma haemocanis (strain Illinois) TaxID=1111676 RepID=H6N769_MYCHN|nr:hypothetical protein [Mycoplasma haemocanis]AEW45491.1 hypothetical protein MHC_03155 [Mycoplasma haemocanis str. Illinois]